MRGRWSQRLRLCVFGFLLIEISARKAVPEVTSTFSGPLHYVFFKNNIQKGAKTESFQTDLSKNLRPGAGDAKGARTFCVLK